MRPRPLRRHPASGAFNPDPSLGQAEDGDKVLSGRKPPWRHRCILSALVPSRLPAIINREGGEMAHGSGYILCR